MIIFVYTLEKGKLILQHRNFLCRVFHWLAWMIHRAPFKATCWKVQLSYCLFYFYLAILPGWDLANLLWKLPQFQKKLTRWLKVSLAMQNLVCSFLKWLHFMGTGADITYLYFSHFELLLNISIVYSFLQWPMWVEQIKRMCVSSQKQKDLMCGPRISMKTKWWQWWVDMNLNCLSNNNKYIFSWMFYCTATNIIYVKYSENSRKGRCGVVLFHSNQDLAFVFFSIFIALHFRVHSNGQLVTRGLLSP